MTTGKTSPRWRVSRVVLVLAGLVGVLGGVAGCGGTDDRPATWSYVSTAILEPSCATANCHSAIAARASVDLSTRAAGYTSLVTRGYVIARSAVPVDTNGMPVIDDDQRVARSAVPQLMRAVGNLRMPPDMPLPETDIQLFEKWIRAGALAD
jgi:hypothetical protein